MAKDKLIPTWLKIAAVAALIVPYSVKLEKDEAERIKKVSARSVAARVTYVPKSGNNESRLDVALFSAADTEDGAPKGKRVRVNKDALKEDLTKLSDKAMACAKRVASGAAELCDKYFTVEDSAENAEYQETV